MSKQNKTLDSSYCEEENNVDTTVSDINKAIPFTINIIKSDYGG